jgi:hypothetical protein
MALMNSWNIGQILYQLIHAVYLKSGSPELREGIEKLCFLAIF